MTEPSKAQRAANSEIPVLSFEAALREACVAYDILQRELGVDPDNLFLLPVQDGLGIEVRLPIGHGNTPVAKVPEMPSSNEVIARGWAEAVASWNRMEQAERTQAVSSSLTFARRDKLLAPFFHDRQGIVGRS